MTATVTQLRPRGSVGPRWPKTNRRQQACTVDGVRLERYGPGWQVALTLLGMERLDGRRWTVVAAHLPNDHPDYTFAAASLEDCIRGLRERGLLPEPEDAA